MHLFPDILVLIRGGGDLGSGVAWRLYRSGFPVIITELAQPLVVRRSVSFASAVYDGSCAVEGVTAWKAQDVLEARELIDAGIIPIIVDPDYRVARELSPQVVIDATMAKRNLGTTIRDAPFVIALGPGFTPKVDCHCVIETLRGHNLGRLLWDSPAAPNTGIPGEIGGKTGDRVLKAGQDGIIQAVKRIGDTVRKGEVIASIDGKNVVSPFDGILRGLVHDGLAVRAGTKIGDVDPRAEREHCFTISDKALAVGGGALEAILSWLQVSEYRTKDR
jgi:xanthine dehydrogenase accessory factor